MRAVDRGGNVGGSEALVVEAVVVAPMLGAAAADMPPAPARSHGFGGEGEAMSSS